MLELVLAVLWLAVDGDWLQPELLLLPASDKVVNEKLRRPKLMSLQISSPLQNISSNTRACSDSVAMPYSIAGVLMTMGPPPARPTAAAALVPVQQLSARRPAEAVLADKSRR